MVYFLRPIPSSIIYERYVAEAAAVWHFVVWALEKQNSIKRTHLEFQHILRSGLKEKVSQSL